MSEVKITLTKDQERVFEGFQKFLKSNDEKVFILQGFAGTGKTTLLKFFIEYLLEKDQPYKLLASTGRAAKIVSDATGISASTVHSMIYKFENFNHNLEEFVENEEKFGKSKDGQLLLQFVMTPVNGNESTSSSIYIIDESSMISDIKDINSNQAVFGSGRLLQDLFDYDKHGKFVFVGDECQLPPVLQDISPALSRDYLRRKYNLTAIEMTLTQIVRQQLDNSIVHASHRIRSLYQNPPRVKWGMLPLGGYDDIHVLPDVVIMINEYLKLIRDDYSRATFISSSNRKCNNLNHLIRKSLGKQQVLEVGDLLLITQNNVSGLMNGDMVVVEQLKPTRYQKAGLTFQLVEVRELVSSKVYSLLLIETLLYGGTTNLSQTQQQTLFIDFYYRMKDKGIRQKDPAFKEMLSQDPYLNALRAVYGYAVTCHKAQGGEWDDVFVDIPRNLTLEAREGAYQWIYTAVTRARKRLYVVDDFFISM